MDQRRFIAFLCLSLLAMMIYNRIFPPAKPPANPAAAAAEGDGKADGKENPNAEAVAAGDDKKAEDEAKAGAQAVAAPVNVQAVAASDVPTKFATIGSLDMDSDYRMLVTVTSAGAAVYRAQMASPRFRDQHDWSGYLGDLELRDATGGGAQVQVVGAGTPAATATANGKAAPIEAGDVIVGVDNPQSSAVKNAADLARMLSRTKPGDEFTLQVRHGDGAPEPRTVKLGRKPFAVLRPESENYKMRDAALPKDFEDRPSFLTTLTALDNSDLKKDDAKKLADVLETGNWELTSNDQSSAEFRRTLPELSLEIVKRYTVNKAPASERDNPNFPAYDLQLAIEVRNTGAADRSFVYRLDGPTGMPLEGWWFTRKISRQWGGGGLRDVAVRFEGGAEQSFDDSHIAKGKVDAIGDAAALVNAGVDGQYFSAMLIPELKAINDIWFATTEAVAIGPLPPPHEYAFTNVTSRLTRKSITIAPNASHSDKFRVFIGPKRPDLLAKYYPANDANYSLKDLLYYGWPIFAAVAQVMLAILHFFYSFVGNYGIAIVMLTVLVRGAMCPLSYKQTKSMARMQALKPEMDRINDKYKNDMQKKSQATQDLYRKNGINPLGGCLPVFLQLPVFIGLYRALSVDVELRQSPLFGRAIHWCSNLAAPDMLWNWSSIMPDFITRGEGIFGLGPYLNVLPIVTVCLFLVTQKMAMPTPTNEQQVMQQKMMKYMTVFMALFFYKVASGLCLYFIASSLWGIAERKLLPKPATADATAGGSSFGGGNGGGSTKPSTNGFPNSKKADKAKRKK